MLVCHILSPQRLEIGFPFILINRHTIGFTILNQFPDSQCESSNGDCLIILSTQRVHPFLYVSFQGGNLV